MTASADEVAREIVRRSWSFGVSVLIAPSTEVEADGVQVSGYFDGEDKKLVVAGEFPEWLATLLHEYSHLTQWAEDSTIWRCDDAWSDKCDIDAWIGGSKSPNVRRAIESRRELEADCERRTVRLIRELDAPIDVPTYCQRSNSYVHFYNTVADTRKWYRPDRRPYYTPEVTALCNTTIDRDFTKTPPALRAALLTCI